jgi:hypothetical protein
VDNPRTAFDFAAEPGDALADVMLIENLSDKAQTIAIYGQEAVLTPDGKYSAPPGRAQEGSFGAWIIPASDELTVDPYGEAQVPFTIQVPVGATPGDYDGALFTTLAQLPSADGEQVVVDLRVGIRVHVRVVGDLAPALAISEITPVRLAPWWNPLPSEVGLNFAVTNTGNVRVEARVATQVVADYLVKTDRFDGLDPAETPELLPGSTITLSAKPVEETGAWARSPYFAKLWGFGKQTFTVHLVSGEVPHSDIAVPTVSRTVEVWVIPWIPAGVVLIVLLWCLRAIWRRIFRKSRERRQAQRIANREAKKKAKSPAKPTSGGAKPAPDAAKPTSGGAKPVPDAAKPRWGGAQPVSDATPPGPDDGSATTAGD